jgi:glycolate oxidase
VTRDYVLALEVVLPTGEVITTGTRTAKGVVGYDLTRLIVGSEGTLGVVTKIVLRLLPLPEVVRTLRAVFVRIQDAGRAVSEIVRSGVIPRSVEYMDQAAIRCVEDYLHIGLPVNAEAMLLLEVDGSPSAADAGLQELAAICEKGGAQQVQIAESEQEVLDLWRARRAISPALFRLGPDKINEDIVVPRSRIPEMVAWIDDLRKRTGLTMVTFGHAGDGNIHFNIMLDKGDKEALNKAEAAVEALFRHTIALGGTLSGEHGVGITKASYLDIELGGSELALMKRIKVAFDPHGILNPGKIFGDP